MKTLVTGGAGFIGSWVSETLLKRGDEVAILDDFNDFYAPAIKEGHALQLKNRGAHIFRGDIRKPEDVAASLESFQPDAVIHLAARAGVRPSIENALLYESANVRGTLVLLEEACRRKIQNFVFASSSSVYGGCRNVPFLEDENDLNPVSPYAATKLAGEKLCWTYSHLYDLPVTALRFFTVYGPRQRPDLAIYKFSRLMMEDKPIPMFGDGSSGRDYTYIGDIADGVLAALDHPRPYEIFNLGNSHPVLLREMIAEIAELTGKTPAIEKYPDQPGDVPITYANIEKARRMLAYAPKTTFRDGLRKFFAWFQEELAARR